MIDSYGKSKYLLATLVFIAGLLTLSLNGLLPGFSAESSEPVRAASPDVKVVELPSAGTVAIIEAPTATTTPQIAVTVRTAAPNYDLADLFVLDNLFSKGALLDPDRTTIGDLLILDRIFNQ